MAKQCYVLSMSEQEYTVLKGIVADYERIARVGRPDCQPAYSAFREAGARHLKHLVGCVSVERAVRHEERSAGAGGQGQKD